MYIIRNLLRYIINAKHCMNVEALRQLGPELPGVVPDALDKQVHHIRGEGVEVGQRALLGLREAQDVLDRLGTAFLSIHLLMDI